MEDVTPALTGEDADDPVKLRQQAAFIEAMACTGVLHAALADAHAKHPDLPRMDRTRVKRWREADDAFDAACREAEETATDIIESEARRRASEGWDEPVFGRQRDGSTAQVGTIRKYDGIMMIFLLKGLRPEKFSDRHTVDLQSGGKPLQLESARARLAEKLLAAMERRRLTEGVLDADVVTVPASTDAPAETE